ncbi:ubiquinol oxidase subunit II [Candidatus Sororendozoicomonas aggregata]|uniref:ubiquinol oxidase subunit II n=1 Tax=Candidatus Sororendozoicomonas aggregata TaxID=3073239 RepID=UPI002ED50789
MLITRKSVLLVTLMPTITLLLSGCHAVLLNPKGWVGASEKELIIIATVLMLIVVVPVCVMTVVFAWRYRASNTTATYSPNWGHSHKIEFFMWFIPIIIITILAIITWRSTHKLDPYRPLYHVPGKPLLIQAVSLNWKWLFILPEQGIATVNYLEIPVNRSLHFKVAADGPMNSLMIPQLGGQIYSMPGMQSQLHLIANYKGLYDGYAVSFSGAGFSQMNFKARAVSDKAFNQWVRKVRSSGNSLDVAEYNRINKPSINFPVTTYSRVKDGLFQDIIMQYMMPGMRDDDGNLIAMDQRMTMAMVRHLSTASPR